MPDVVLYIAGAALVLLFAGLFALSMGDAVDRRRAWNLWAAGLIDDDELRRRLGER
jgi:cytochrome c biogenesis protein CcdA